MRIGLTARGSSTDELVEHARWAEAAGFTSVWSASVTGGDPAVSMAFAGRATSSIEIGTAVLQTYPCHPVLQANRMASVVSGMNRPGLALGIGPSHESYIRGVYGLSYDHPGRSTEEYVRILSGLLAGESVDFDGNDWSAHGSLLTPLDHPVPVLVAALGPRLLRAAGAIADGTILYMVAANVIESRVMPQLEAAAADAGKPAPRVVAGLPVAVHDDLDEARAAYANGPGQYAATPNYQRVVAEGGYGSAADLAIVGDEASVAKQLRSVIDAGANDIWAGIFPVGDDAEGSLRRTTDLLASLIG